MGTSKSWCYTEAKTGGGKGGWCQRRPQALGAWVQMAGEETSSRQEVSETEGCWTVQNPHTLGTEDHKERCCMKAGIADRQRAVGSLLSCNSFVRKVAFMWLGKSKDFLIWSQGIQEYGTNSRSKLWCWVLDLPLSKNCSAFGYENKISITEEAEVHSISIFLAYDSKLHPVVCYLH